MPTRFFFPVLGSATPASHTKAATSSGVTWLSGCSAGWVNARSFVPAVRPPTLTSGAPCTDVYTTPHKGGPWHGHEPVERMRDESYATKSLYLSRLPSIPFTIRCI